MTHTREIYLDHAATSPVHPEVLGLMLPYFGKHFGTPSHPLSFGDRPRAALAQARSRVARLIGAHEHEIVFTSSGTEANNLAVLGVASAQKGAKKHLIISSIEHRSILDAAHHLRDTGFEVTELCVDSRGLIDPASLKAAVRDDTFLISVIYASNETGSIQPIKEIGQIAKEKGVTFHCDCIQSAGKTAIDVNDLHVDMLSISSHKIYGPKGAGALYVRDHTAISPLLFGSDQERGLRPGAVNVPCIVGFGLACEKAMIDLEKNSGYIAGLRDMLEHSLEKGLPGVRVNDRDAPRLAHLSSISFEGIQADSLAAWLDLTGITISARASFYSKRASQSLAALHVPPELAFGTVRISPGWENTASEMKKVVEAIQATVKRMRLFSDTLGGEEACIITFAEKKDLKHALANLEKEGFPLMVTARPLELAHLTGLPTAVAIPGKRQDEAGRLLGSLGINITGMYGIKGLCRFKSEKEEQFWDKVKRIKEEKKE